MNPFNNQFGNMPEEMMHKLKEAREAYEKLTLKEKIVHCLNSGLTVRLDVSSLTKALAKSYNQDVEGYLRMELVLGSQIYSKIELREHHGKAWTADRKAEMLTTARDFKKAIDEAIDAFTQKIEETETDND